VGKEEAKEEGKEEEKEEDEKKEEEEEKEREEEKEEKKSTNLNPISLTILIERASCFSMSKFPFVRNESSMGLLEVIL